MESRGTPLSASEEVPFLTPPLAHPLWPGGAERWRCSASCANFSGSRTFRRPPQWRLWSIAAGCPSAGLRMSLPRRARRRWVQAALRLRLPGPPRRHAHTLPTPGDCACGVALAGWWRQLCLRLPFRRRRMHSHRGPGLASFCCQTQDDAVLLRFLSVLQLTPCPLTAHPPSPPFPLRLAMPRWR